MISWSEETDRYVLRVSRWEEVLFASVSLLAFLAGAAMLLQEIEVRRKEIPWVCPVAWVVVISFFVIVIYTHWSHRAWVELPLQGGTVRWGSPGDSGSVEASRILRFDVEWLTDTKATVALELRDGTRIRILRRWDTHATGRVKAKVEQLNAILDSGRAGELPHEGSSAELERGGH